MAHRVDLYVGDLNLRGWRSLAECVDRVLAQHYGFPDEELDFIINYDIKNRMGDALGGEEDEE